MSAIKVVYADKYLDRLYGDCTDAELIQTYQTCKAELQRRGRLKEDA